MFNFIFAVLFTIMPACQEEDSTNCRWNAQVQGNGYGHSFVNIAGHVTYIN